MACPKNLMILEFSETFGTTEIDQVALFNCEVISIDKVQHIVESIGSMAYQKDIVFMSKEQWENLKDPDQHVKELKVQADLLQDLMMEQKEQM
jgi:hypothetical protein